MPAGVDVALPEGVGEAGSRDGEGEAVAEGACETLGTAVEVPLSPRLGVIPEVATMLD